MLEVDTQVASGAETYVAVLDMMAVGFGDGVMEIERERRQRLWRDCETFKFTFHRGANFVALPRMSD